MTIFSFIYWMIRNWFIFFMFCFRIANAQATLNNNVQKLVFHPVFHSSVIKFDDTYFKLKSGDSIQFETLKFYISSIIFLNNNVPVWKEENSFRLIDVADEKTTGVLLNTLAAILFNEIKFNLGVDSITNSSGALGGDLDPTKGMYWTWQNGYINFKLEGRSNLCNTRKNEFQFHLGGYQYPYNALQTITLITEQHEQIDINIDLEKLFSEINLVNENEIMSPGKEAVLLSKKVASCFSMPVK